MFLRVMYVVGIAFVIGAGLFWNQIKESTLLYWSLLCLAAVIGLLTLIAHVVHARQGTDHDGV